MIHSNLILLEAMTPIAHGDTVTGVDNATNTRLFMRQGAVVNGKPARIPSISENALRSVLFREPLHDDLVTRLGIGRGALPQSAVNLLYSGGNMASGSKAPGDEIALGHQVKTLYPSLDLLGGAVDGFILPRSRLRLAAWIVCREYAHLIRHVAPDVAAEAESISVFDLITEETRTRGTGAESTGNQMLYTYETLASGVRILVEVTLDSHTSDATADATSHALAAWGGYIGGQSRQGRGRMAILRNGLPDAQPYIDHVAGHAEAMRDGLVTGRLGTGKTLCAA